jgi:hypothetical protein
MSITIKDARRISGATMQVVCFTLVDGKDSYEWHCNAPVFATVKELQAHLDMNADRYLVDILLAQYPWARYSPAEGESELDAFRAWIAAGALNNEGEDEAGNPIPVPVEKVPFVSTHPPEVAGTERLIDGKKISAATVANLDSATTVDELRAVLKTILLGT